MPFFLKFMFSKKAKKIDEISTLDGMYLANVKSKVDISSSIVIFLENLKIKVDNRINLWFLNLLSFPIRVHAGCYYCDALLKFIWVEIGVIIES